MKYDAKAKDRPLMPVELICRAEGLPMPEPEFYFARPRRWRLDWFWRQDRGGVALEVEGGAWIYGRHTRPKGFLSDMEKYNRATAMGIRIFRCTPNSIHLGMQLVKEALHGQ